MRRRGRSFRGESTAASVSSGAGTTTGMASEERTASTGSGRRTANNGSGCRRIVRRALGRDVVRRALGRDVEGAYGEHWVGTDRLHWLTSQRPCRLRVDLWDWDGGGSSLRPRTCDIVMVFVVDAGTGTVDDRLPSITCSLSTASRIAIVSTYVVTMATQVRGGSRRRCV